MLADAIGRPLHYASRLSYEKRPMQLFRPWMAVVALLTLYALIMAAGQKPASNLADLYEKRLAMTPYAVVKRPSLPVMRREALASRLPEPYPAHGVILGEPGYLDTRDWTIVDFDRLTAERFTVKMSRDGNPTIDLYSRSGRSLSVDEANPIIEEANAIWNPPPTQLAPPVLAPTDSSCEVALLDERDVLYDRGGASCPTGAKHLIEKIHGVLVAPTPTW